MGFPESLVGKESSCSAGDPGSIPRLGRYAREGIGYSLQYSWGSLVDQLVKNPPAMWENWVQSLGWEDPIEKERLPIPVFWPGEFCGLYSPWGHKESDGTFTGTFTFTHLLLLFYIIARTLYLKFWIKFIGRLLIINYILGEESCFRIFFIRKGSCGCERSN